MFPRMIFTSPHVSDVGIFVVIDPRVESNFVQGPNPIVVAARLRLRFSWTIASNSSLKLLEDLAQVARYFAHLLLSRARYLVRAYYLMGGEWQIECEAVGSVLRRYRIDARDRLETQTSTNRSRVAHSR